jgi:hypothetical protein
MIMPDYTELSANQIGGVCSPIERRLYILLYMASV